MKLFLRTDKEVIADANNLSVEDFVKKYKSYTGEEILSKAYLEIQRANPQLKRNTDSIEGAVKVIKIATSKKLDPLLKKDSPKIKDSLKDKIEHRTSRIKSLLSQNIKPKVIIEMLAKENISVHLPQITSVKQSI